MTPLPLGILASSFPLAAGPYDLLETEILTSSQASVTFSSLGSYSYQHFQIRGVARASGGGQEPMDIELNGVTSASYSAHRLIGNGSTVTSNAYTSDTAMSDIAQIGNVTTTDSYAGVIIDILDAFNTNKNTTVRVFSGVANDASRIVLGSGLFIDTSAVSSITLKPPANDFLAKTRFSIYGLGGA